MSAFFNNRSNFRKCFIINIFFSMITFVEFISYFFVVMLFFWGFYLLLKNYIRDKGFKDVYLWKDIALFFTMCLIGAVVQFSSGIICSFINISTLVISAFYLFTFYGMHTEDIQDIKKELYTVCKTIIIITTVCAVIGFILLAIFHKTIWIADRHIIIYENRFEGIYINPNPHGFACFTALFSCIIVTRENLCKEIGIKPVSKKLIIPCAVLNSTALLLSDSNSSILILSSFLIGICCYAIFGRKKLDSGRQIAIRTATLVLCCFAIVFGLLLLRDAVGAGAGKLMANTPYLSLEKLESDESVNMLQTEDGNVTFEHINKNLDSGRLKLYNRAFESIKDNPVFGVGYGDILYNGFLEKGKLFDYHNGYLTIMASNGLIAFAIFLIFGLRIAKRMSVGVFTSTFYLKRDTLPFLFSFICAYCIYACVEPTMLYYPSYQTAFFWFVFGSGFAVFSPLDKNLLMK